jgi:hypothetical protein
LTNIREHLVVVKKALAVAQETQRRFADKKRTERVFATGDMVYLNAKNISSSRPSMKLDYTLLGPFKVLERIGHRAYRLDLPPTVNIHPVFHVSLLEPVTHSPFSSRSSPTPPPVLIDGHMEMEVRSILDSRLRHRRLEYLVSWLGYLDAEATWEPAANLKNCKELVAAFHAQHPHKPGLRRKFPKFRVRFSS